MAPVFHIPPELLKSVASVRALEQVDTSVMFKVFDAGENEPRFIDAFRHRMLLSRLHSSRYAIADWGEILAHISN
jgi:hypothetical protein